MIIAGSRTNTYDELSKYPAELAPITQEEIIKAKPKTMVVAGSRKDKSFSEGKRDRKKLKEYRAILAKGGFVTTALELYPILTLANGYKFLGDKNGEIQAWDEAINLNAIMFSGIMDAISLGDGFQENVSSRGTALEIAKLEHEGKAAELAIASKTSDIVTLIPRNPVEFDITIEDNGVLKGYVQVEDEDKGTGIKLKPEQITHLVLIPQTGSPYGRGMIERAYDDVMRDVKIATASSEAIYRHGFKKYHVKVGTTGEIIDETTMTTISNKFQDIETKNEWVTCYDVDIKNIDEGGLEQIDKYNDISLSRVCAALGIPEEMLGLRRGSTDATAVSRIKVFYKKIQFFQKMVAHCYNINVIDRKTGKPGSVKMVFAPPDPEDHAILAEWISKIIKSSPADPFAVLPAEWIQDQLNIDMTEWATSPTSAKPPAIKDTTTVPEKPATPPAQ